MNTNTTQPQESTTPFKRMPKGFWWLDSYIGGDRYTDRRIQMILDSDPTAKAGPYFCRDLDIEIEAQEMEDFLERLEVLLSQKEMRLKEHLEQPGVKAKEGGLIDAIEDHYLEGWDIQTDIKGTIELVNATKARIHLLRSNQSFNASTTPKEVA